MTELLKANIDLLHVAGGEEQNSPPPGTLALSPPRKAARGRAHDYLFVSLKLLGTAGEGRTSRLAQSAAQAFFGTPGSVTAALRQAAMAVNQELVDSGLEAGLVVGALRGQNLYFSECGAGEIILVRFGVVSRMYGSKRPLGSSLAPMIQFQHLEVRPSDLIILTAADDVPWSDLSLAGLTGLALEQVSDRLVEATDRDITGLVIQVPATASVASPRSAPDLSAPSPAGLTGLDAPARSALDASDRSTEILSGSDGSPRSAPDANSGPGVGLTALETGDGSSQSSPDPPIAEGEHTVGHEHPVGQEHPAGSEHSSGRPSDAPARASTSDVEGPGRRTVAEELEDPGHDPDNFSRNIPGFGMRRIAFRLRAATKRVSRMAVEVIVRLIPGTLDPQQFDEFSPNLLAFTAAAVPILVVGLSSLIYFKHGRVEQFESYLAQAQSAVISAQIQAPGEDSRPDWLLASQWLDLAESYRTSQESLRLGSQIQLAFDELDQVIRLDFVPAVSGGFGPKANLTFVAATATDLYAYDEGTGTIWHAWATGRGYEIDSQFECLAGADNIPAFGRPISMVIQREPGALGTEGVVAIDGDGSLLYCAPGAEPLTGQLAAPDLGWGTIQSIEVFGNKLYVLDPVKNAVWIYDAADGLFSGSPALYFVEEVRELGTAIDLALAQDELIILYADGRIDRCRRTVENTLEGNLRIRVECESEPQFQDERAGFGPRATIPGAEPLRFVYSPPPEPSLFFLDGIEGTVFHYSMRLVYQAQYPTTFEAQVSAITGAPPNDLFVAAGDQIYFAQLGR